MPKIDHRFTSEDVQYLRDNYEQMGARAVAKHLGRDLKSVYNKVSILGIKGKIAHEDWSEEDVKFLEDNFGKMSDRNIAKVLNCAEHRVVGKAVRMGLRRSKDEEWTEKQDRYLRKHYTGSATDDFLAKLKKTRYEINCRARRLGIKKQQSIDLESITCLAVFPRKRHRDVIGFGWGVGQVSRYTIKAQAWEVIKDKEGLDFTYDELRTRVMPGLGDYLDGEKDFLVVDDPRLSELLASDVVKENLLNVGIPTPRPPRVKKIREPKPPRVKKPKPPKLKEPKPPRVKKPKPPKVNKVKEPSTSSVEWDREPMPPKLPKMRLPRTTGRSQCYVVDAEGICGMAWTGGKPFNDFYLEVMKAHNAKFDELQAHQFGFTRIASLDFYSKPLKFIDFNEDDDESVELMEMLRDLGFFAKDVPLEDDTFIAHPLPKGSKYEE